MDRNAPQGSRNHICTFRYDACDRPAIAEIPLPANGELMQYGQRMGTHRLYKTIYTCAECADVAIAQGYLVLRFDETELEANARHELVIKQRHFQLRGTHSLVGYKDRTKVA